MDMYPELIKSIVQLSFPLSPRFIYLSITKGNPEPTKRPIVLGGLTSIILPPLIYFHSAALLFLWVIFVRLLWRKKLNEREVAWPGQHAKFALRGRSSTTLQLIVLRVLALAEASNRISWAAILQQIFFVVSVTFFYQ